MQTHAINMKQVYIPQASEKIKIIFRWRPVLGDLAWKLLQAAYFPKFQAKYSPTKKMRKARGKITIPKMTARSMCINFGMIMWVGNDFDFGPNCWGSEN